MKKIIVILLMMFFTMVSANADVQPYNTSEIPSCSIGFFQTSTSVKIFEKPDLNSKVVYETSWDYKKMADFDTYNLFGLLIQNKELSYVYATDVDENWVEVLYDKKNDLKGWIQKEDEFQFLPWISFYNLYGRKYGLRILKDTPSYINGLYSASDENSQIVGRINVPKAIRLTAIKGNWALVSALDMDKIPKTGFIRWRAKEGSIYLFPAIK